MLSNILGACIITALLTSGLTVAIVIKWMVKHRYGKPVYLSTFLKPGAIFKVVHVFRMERGEDLIGVHMPGTKTGFRVVSLLSIGQDFGEPLTIGTYRYDVTSRKDHGTSKVTTTEDIHRLTPAELAELDSKKVTKAA
jgi:hypothetical protein